MASQMVKMSLRSHVKAKKRGEKEKRLKTAVAVLAPCAKRKRKDAKASFNVKKFLHKAELDDVANGNSVKNVNGNVVSYTRAQFALAERFEADLLEHYGESSNNLHICYCIFLTVSYYDLPCRRSL